MKNIKLSLIILLLLCMVTMGFSANATQSQNTIQIEQSGFIDVIWTTLLTILVISLILVLAITTQNGLIGIFGALGMLIQGVNFWGTSILLGTITVASGLMLALYFALMKPK